MDVAYDSVVVGAWDAWLNAWILTAWLIAAIPMALVVVLIVAVAATELRTVRRRFWCALHQRDVEVRFASRGLLPAPLAVLSCSAFEPGHAVACRRRCMDARYRRQWPPALADTCSRTTT